MPKLPTVCPACEGALEVTRLTCPACAMNIEGQFGLPELLRLPREDLDFVLAFVRASGSLKEMGKILGQSYPTVRNRLDDIIKRLSHAQRDGSADGARKKILDALARGQLSVKEAAKKLKEIEP